MLKNKTTLITLGITLISIVVFFSVFMIQFITSPVKQIELRSEDSLSEEIIVKKIDDDNKEDEDGFVINKKLLDVGEREINFPKQCNYQEKTNEDGVEYGFAFSYISKNRECPFLMIKSKNVKIKDYHWGLIGVERKDGKIQRTYGGKQQRWQKVSEHIYKSTIYMGIECSSSIDTSIIYEFPKKSILDFVSIRISDEDGDFKEKDFKEICLPKQSVIDEKINKISKKEHKSEVELLQEMFENKN